MKKFTVTKTFKTLKSAVCILFAILLVFLVSCTKDNSDIVYKHDYKNVILMIGDGMGYSHIQSTELYSGEKTFLNTGALGCIPVTTNSLTMFSPTDSAAAATALSTGKKTTNGAIARYNGEDIKTNAERAKAKGMAVGIIATEGMQGATPAGFSAHADKRGDSYSILKSQLKSGIDLFLGGNKEVFDSQREIIENGGYTYFNDFSVDFSNVDRVWGAYKIKQLPSSEGDGVSLTELVEKAISYLEKASDKGYFLMVEESYIDKRSHSNDIFGMFDMVKSFDSAVKKAVELAQKSGNTLVMATADHETGKLTIPENARADECDNSWFYSDGHTDKNVPLFYFMPIGTFKNQTIDNTDIAKICQHYIEKK